MQEIVCAEWTWREYRDVLHCFLHGNRDAGRHIGEMLAIFSELFPKSTLFPVNRGRVALGLALRAFAKLEPRKRQVIYPAYICESVPEAIEGAGLAAVPADVGVDLNLGPEHLEATVGRDTLAVIAVHAYGCPASITELERFCRQRAIFLIDDAANVVGVHSENGRMLGGFGDAGVISFTASKSVVAGGYNAGGLLLVNNPEIIDTARREWETLPEPSYGIADFLLFLRDLQFERYTRYATYYYSALNRRVFGKVASHPWSPARMPNISAATAIRQLQSLPGRIAGRVRVAALFERHLASLPGVLFPQYAPDRYLTRILVLLPEHVDREAVRSSLRRRGFGTRRGYSVKLRKGPDSLAISAIAPRLLELPSHSRMTDSAVATICAALHHSLDILNTEKPRPPESDGRAASSTTSREQKPTAIPIK